MHRNSAGAHSAVISKGADPTLSGRGLQHVVRIWLVPVKERLERLLDLYHSLLRVKWRRLEKRDKNNGRRSGNQETLKVRIF